VRFDNGGTGGLDLRIRAGCTHNIDVCLIAGLLVLGLGIHILLFGIYGYFSTDSAFSEVGDTIEEHAEEMGVGDVPGFSVDDHIAQFFTIVILAGACMIVIGAVLLSVELLRKKRVGEKRP